MDIQTFDVTLVDGRVLKASATGPSEGTVLIHHHGTPSDGSIFLPAAEQAAALGLRTVAYSRPGYAGSTRDEGRTIADCAADAAALADHLGAERFLTMGVSGGGPHALACASLLPERVISCATISGCAPWDADGLDFLEGMAPENHVEFGAAVAGPEELRACLEGFAADESDVSGSDVAKALGDLVSAPDVEVLTGEYAEFVAASFRASMSTGIGGWFDDDVAFVRPWGFELDQIHVPVRVWQGEQDMMVPASHGRWLAQHIPGARAEIHPDHGHLSLRIAQAGAIYDALLADGGSR